MVNNKRICLGMLGAYLFSHGIFATSTESNYSELPADSPLPYFKEWPQISSAISKRDYIEERVTDIVEQMTLGEKVGQMIMPEYRQITPKDDEKENTFNCDIFKPI